MASRLGSKPQIGSTIQVSLTQCLPDQFVQLMVGTANLSTAGWIMGRAAQSPFANTAHMSWIPRCGRRILDHHDSACGAAALSTDEHDRLLGEIVKTITAREFLS
jgi:hypothetical protein